MKKLMTTVLLAVSLTAFGQNEKSSSPIMYQGVRVGLSLNNYVGSDAKFVDADVNKGEYDVISNSLGNRVGHMSAMS